MGGWLAGGVPLLNNFFAIYFESISKIHCAGGAYVTRQHYGLGVAGGHLPAKIAISTGTKLLADVAPANTNVF
jgi:hypothetical protein